MRVGPHPHAHEDLALERRLSRSGKMPQPDAHEDLSSSRGAPPPLAVAAGAALERRLSRSGEGPHFSNDAVTRFGSEALIRTDVVQRR